MDISSDCLFIVSLSSPVENDYQEVAVWAWTKEIDTALLRRKVISEKFQYKVSFNFIGCNFITTGPEVVTFWHTEEFHIDGYNGKFRRRSLGNFGGQLTSTIFMSNSCSAVSATDDGYVLLWESQNSSLLLDKGKDKGLMSASKVIRLLETGITTLYAMNDYLAVGSKDGAVRFYDHTLRLEAWFEDLAAGPVSSLSFSVQGRFICFFSIRD